MVDRNNTANEHAWVEERLSAYVDNRLAPLEHAQLERHLRDCARCQASLASLRWTVSLVKQAPAPALPRQFTLPLPAQARRAPAYGFGFARLATVVATLLLFSAVGVDFISQLGGAFRASAPAALREAVNPTSLALALTEPANQSQPAAPTAAPILQALPTAAPPAPLPPPVPAAVPPRAPTETFGRGGGPGETSATDGAAKGALGTPTAPRVQAPARTPAESATPVATALAAGAASIATPVPPTATPQPTATAIVAPPTATPTRPSPTPAAQVLLQPTVPASPRQAEAPAPVVEPLRVAEIGLFFFVVLFGALTFMLRRRG